MATLTTSYQLLANTYIGNVYSAGEVSSKNLYLRIYAKYSAQSSSTSTVVYKSTLYVDGGGYFYTLSTTTKSLSGTGITSTSANAQGTYYGGSETTLCEVSGTVTHNSSGAASVSITAGWVSTPWEISGTTTASASLPTIAKASTISSITSSVAVGSSVTVNISRSNSSYKHYVRFYINDTYDSGRFSGVETSKSFTIPSTWASAITSSSCTAYCRVQTYDSNGNNVGSYVEKSFTVTLAAGTTGVKIGNIYMEPLTYGILIQGKNQFRIGVEGSQAGAGAQIVSYTFSGDGISKTVNTSSTSVYVTGGPTVASMTEDGYKYYSITVTDSRGNTDQGAAMIYCCAYSTPKFTTFRTSRCNSDGSANSNGAYIKCDYSIAYSSVGGTNSIKSAYIYVNSSQTQITGQSGSKVIYVGNSSSSLNVYGWVQDNYGGTGTSNQSAVYASRIFNAAADGMGFAIGKLSERDEEDHPSGLFECAFDADFKNMLTVGGSAALTSANYKNYITSYTDSNVNSYLTTNHLMPTTLYSYSYGTNATISNLNDSLANYTYIDIFYVDNNKNGHGFTRVHQPNGKYIDLSLIEAGEGGFGITWIRRTMYLASGTQLILKLTNDNGNYIGGIVKLSASTTPISSAYPNYYDVSAQMQYPGANYLYITQIVGYK